MELDIVQEMLDPPHPVRRVLERHATDNSVNLVPFGEEEFRQIRAVLARDTGDERSFHSGQSPLRWQSMNLQFH
jgi:hypothetical protein